MKVIITHYFNPSPSMQKLMRSKNIYNLAFKTIGERMAFEKAEWKTFFLQRNGTRLLFSINEGYSLDSVVDEIKSIGFNVSIIE